MTEIKVLGPGEGPEYNQRYSKCAWMGAITHKKPNMVMLRNVVKKSGVDLEEMNEIQNVLTVLPCPLT